MLLGEQNLYQILSRYADVGWVTKKEHPDYPELALFHYTPETEHNGYWDQYTMMARGIVIRDDGKVITRPFVKFFNAEQLKDTPWPPSDYEVQEKLDGSLVNISWYNDEPLITTKNSFTSPQVAAVRAFLDEPRPSFLSSQITYVCEWIAPENRIVVDYGDRRELVLLTAFSNLSGAERPYAPWPWSRVERRREIEGLPGSELAQHIGENEEGYVLKFRSGERIKVKGEWFQAAHRARWGLTERAIWKCYKQRRWDDLRAMREVLADDDEAREWFDAKEIELRNQIDAALNGAYRAIPAVPTPATRKEAIAVLRQASQDAGVPLHVLIALFDGDEELATNMVVEDLKPGHSPFVPTRQFSEIK